MEGGGAVKAAARAPHRDGHRFESPQLHQEVRTSRSRVPSAQNASTI
jgi:hypothetical protein